MTQTRSLYAEMMQQVLAGELSLSEVKNQLLEEERGFANMLFMTAFRKLTFLKENVLPQFVKKKIPAKHKILESILYLGTTELLFMNTPDYAVINSYVEAAKEKTDKFGANFVNAVLRNILRNKDNFLTHKSMKYFCKNFLKILKQDYSLQTIREIEKFAAIEPPLDISMKKDCFVDMKGIMLPTGSLRIEANVKVAELPGFNDGIWWVQDAASAIAVKCLDNLCHKKVLDLCAAPGGKTAQLLEAGAKVTAVDISEKRLAILRQNITRLGLTQNLTTICQNALLLNTDEKFDVVLVDAPCSATGTFRRHPEIIHTKTLIDVKKQCELQKDILEKAKTFTALNGILVYATCSLSKAEGEEQIKNFLLNNKEYQILPIKLKGTEKMQTTEGFLRILPQYFGKYGGIDGFFIACLQRKI